MIPGLAQWIAIPVLPQGGASWQMLVNYGNVMAEAYAKAAALIQPLAQELPYAAGMAIKMKKKNRFSYLHKDIIWVFRSQLNE